MDALNKETIVALLGGAAIGAGLTMALSSKCCAPKKAAGGAVRSTTDSGVGGAGVYESAKATNEYLLFHYAPPDALLPYAFGPRSALEFPRRTAELTIGQAKAASLPLERALDVGCAVGAASFELARGFGEVVGIDFSHAFVAAAKDMQAKGSHVCTCTDESEVTSEVTVRLPAGVDASRCAFQQGDACALPASLGKFSAIHGSNLLCRLPDPDAFLSSLPRHLVPGGIVVLVSPYSWLAEYTPKERWVGGYVDASGNKVRSADRLRSKMDALGFDLVHEEDTPFLIREHARKYQWGCSHATVWRLRRA